MTNRIVIAGALGTVGRAALEHFDRAGRLGGHCTFPPAAGFRQRCHVAFG